MLGHAYKGSGVVFKGEAQEADACVHEQHSRHGMRVCGQPRAAHVAPEDWATRRRETVGMKPCPASSPSEHRPASPEGPGFDSQGGTSTQDEAQKIAEEYAQKYGCCRHGRACAQTPWLAAEIRAYAEARAEKAEQALESLRTESSKQRNV